jgi:uncharacterized protein YndB with AHSA1/START domain
MSDHGVIVDSGTVRFERLLPGPIERVWSYLTESEKRQTWLAAGEMELRVGGRVEHVFDNARLSVEGDGPPPKYAEHTGESRMRGTITAYDPPRLLAYTWNEAGDDESEVTFELTPRGSKVLLALTHRRLGDRDAVVSVSGGWHAHLGILAERLAGQEPASFWSTHTRLEAEYEERIPV